MTAVEYRQVCMAYGGRNVIENFNLKIEKGEFITIIGSSGCGKTTILKMVNGLLMPTAGQVLVNGKDTQTLNLTELRRHTGYAIQGNLLFPHLTVEKNIAFVPGLANDKSQKEIKSLVAKWMEIVGLDRSLRKRYPRELSGGQQQRVGIARALATSPELLLMDEPFSAVDEITRSALQDEIKRIHSQTGLTVMFVTHDINEAFKLADRTLVMNGGAAVQFDSPAAIAQNPANNFVRMLVGDRATDAKPAFCQ